MQTWLLLFLLGSGKKSTNLVKQSVKVGIHSFHWLFVGVDLKIVTSIGKKGNL